MAARSELLRHRLGSRVMLWASVALLCACETQSSPRSTRAAVPDLTPDRLSEEERAPDTATAFGLSLPRGMRLTQKFSDSAYFMGDLELATVVEHLKPHLVAQRVEEKPGYTGFENAQIKGDDSNKRLRVDVSAEGIGTQVFVQNVTPPPAPRGLSEAQILRQTGRGPDGKPLDENQAY